MLHNVKNTYAKFMDVWFLPCSFSIIDIFFFSIFLIPVHFSLTAPVLFHGLVVPVQYVPLGNKVRIPCDGYGDHRTGKWLHKKGENKFETIFHENSGFTFQNKPLSTRKKIFRNFSLEITHFTELDKGTYVCQSCTSIMRCTNGKPITLLPLFGKWKSIPYIL